MIRRPPRSTQSRSSAASDVYKRQDPCVSSRGGAVHVATTRRHYKDRVYETHLLRRSYREGGKVKTETVGNLSHLPPELIDLVRRGLAGERFLPASGMEIRRSVPHGHVAAVLGTLRSLGVCLLYTSPSPRD